LSIFIQAGPCPANNSAAELVLLSAADWPPPARRSRLAKKLDRDLVRQALNCFLKNPSGLCKFGGVETDAYSATVADQSFIAFQQANRLLKIAPAFWALKAYYVRIYIWHRNLGSVSSRVPRAIEPECAASIATEIRRAPRLAARYFDAESCTNNRTASCTVVMNWAGKIIVEFFSTEISAIVWSVRS
jgi:hypothetical protein